MRPPLMKNDILAGATEILVRRRVVERPIHVREQGGEARVHF